MHAEMVYVECNGDAAAFVEAVKKVTGKGKTLVLACKDADAVKAALDVCKDEKPIVNGADASNYEKMVEIANENDVPVYEDNSLATVLSQLDLGREIPEELYKAVVDIYAYFLHFVPGSWQSEEKEEEQETGEAIQEKDEIHVGVPEEAGQPEWEDLSEG